MSIPDFNDSGWLSAGHHPCTWNEMEERFGGTPGSVRSELTDKLLHFRDELRTVKITGYLVLDGSYVSAKAEPHDFDVLLVAYPRSPLRVEDNPDIKLLLDAEHAEKVRGFSLLFVPSDSSVLPLIETVWDVTKQGMPKGIVKVAL